VLKDLIEHCNKEEESPMFKRASALKDASQLTGPGAEMEARKQDLIAHWRNPVTHP